MIMHPQNVSQTQWLIHIYHVLTRSWLIVLTISQLNLPIYILGDVNSNILQSDGLA